MRHFFIFFLLISLLSCFSREPEKTKQQGKALPSFKVLLPDSATWLNSEVIPENRANVLFIFSPSCPYSRAQTEEIIEDIEELKDVHFYMITTGSFANMKSYFEHYNLQKYRNITMAFDDKNFLGNYFEVSAVPYLAFYDKNKKLSKAFIGKMYTTEIIKAVNE